MDSLPEEETDKQAALPCKFPLGESDVFMFTRGAGKFSWRQMPPTDQEAARNRLAAERVARMAEGGALPVLVGGLNGRNPQEGSRLRWPFVIMSNDDPQEDLSSPDGSSVVATSVSSVEGDAPTHLSGDWGGPAVTVLLPDVFRAIIFHVGAAPYINDLALQLLASKLAPGGCLVLQIQGTFAGGGEIINRRFEFSYTKDGSPWSGLCFAPPWAIRGALESCETLRGRFAVSVVMTQEEPLQAETSSKESNYKQYLQQDCEEQGIPFVFCDRRSALSHICRPGALSEDDCMALLGAVGGRDDILRFHYVPVAVIQRIS
jgi:hypothetical protein